jgi:hypothetical protein
LIVKSKLENKKVLDAHLDLVSYKELWTEHVAQSLVLSKPSSVPKGEEEKELPPSR